MGVGIMKSNMSKTSERQLLIICEKVSHIYNSKEFKQLYKEMSKLYRKKGIRDPKIIAFQDTLFCLYSEQYDGEITSQSQTF
jgi:hypothetical protein